MKDPDGVFESICQAAIKEAEKLDIDAGSKATVAQNITDNLNEMVTKWFEFGEYLTVQIDTKAKTIKVLEVDV